MCIFGGYKTQTVLQVANLFSVFDAEKITLRQLRIYFGCLVITAAREAAKRSRKSDRQGRAIIPPRYLKSELSRLTGCPIARVRGELRALEEALLLRFTQSEITFTETPLPGSHDLLSALTCGRSGTRPVPIPRPLLRYLCKCKKVSTIKTILAYCIRGLSLSRTGEITGKGSVKATWIAEVMNLSERSVRSARSELLELGWITDDEGSYQRKLNRDGAYFTINLSCRFRSDSSLSDSFYSSSTVRVESGTHSASASIPTQIEQLSREETSEVVAERAVDNSSLNCSQFAPPMAQNCSSFAPPYKDRKTPYGSKHQKTRGTEPTGVCMANKEKSGEEKPKIYDVKRDDLGNFSRVEELFFQAVRRKLIEPTEAGAVNFLAAAVRAKSVSGDAPRIFMGIIKHKLWHHVSQADEDRALAALRRYREERPERFRYRFEDMRVAA